MQYYGKLQTRKTPVFFSQRHFVKQNTIFIEHVIEYVWSSKIIFKGFNFFIIKSYQLNQDVLHFLGQNYPVILGVEGGRG